MSRKNTIIRDRMSKDKAYQLITNKTIARIHGRGKGKVFAPRLCRLPIRARALETFDLLRDVVQFKMRFYRCSWARYEEAQPGSLRLLPPEYRSAVLRKDYQSMPSEFTVTLDPADQQFAKVELDVPTKAV